MPAKLLALPAAFVAAVVADGALHGRATGRWRPLPGVQAYADRLPLLPAAVGGWAGTDEPLADAESLARAGIQGHLYRRYTEAATGRAVGVLVVCGRPGPISVHTPDVCYRGAGYEATEAEAEVTVAAGPGRQATYRRLRFAAPSADAHRALAVYWGWVTPAGVTAPSAPRLAFAREPAIYKVYVIDELPVTAGGGKGGPTAGEAFLPELSAAVDARLRPPAAD